MIVIDNVLVSDEIAEKKFVCDLSKCKGGCCEDGDAGAPLDEEELQTVLDNYEKILPYLTPEAIRQIDRRGKYLYHKEFGWVTPTLDTDNEICVYAFREKNGLIKCAFEQAYNDGIIGWKKPVSCHLYPIIAVKGRKGGHDRMNYEPREKLCKPACGLGERLKVPVHEFLKEPLIRKYGEAFYEALDHVVKKKQRESEVNAIKK